MGLIAMLKCHVGTDSRGSVSAKTIAGVGLLSLAVTCGTLPVAAITQSRVVPIVKPTDVGGIVKTYTAQNNYANSTLNLRTLALAESGTAYQIDREIFQINKLASNSALGGTYYPFSFTLTSQATPNQTTYPADFFATTKFTPSVGTPDADKTCVNLSFPDLLFVKSSSSSTWRVVEEPISWSSPGQFKVDGSGFVKPTPTSGLKVPISQIPARMAYGLQYYSANHKFVPGLASNDFGSVSGCYRMWDLWSLRSSALTRRIIEATSVTPGSTSDVHSFALANGGALVAFTERINFHNTPAGTSRWIYYVGTPHQPYTWLIAKGNYSYTNFPVVCDMLAIDPPGATTTVSTAVPTLIGAQCSNLMASGKLY